jgi:hypothetical protein
VGTGQLILSMELVWIEIRILVQRATTPNKGFFLYFITTHVLLFVICAVNKLLVFSCFTPLQVKNKPCDGDPNLHLFSGLLACLQHLLLTSELGDLQIQHSPSSHNR